MPVAHGFDTLLRESRHWGPLVKQAKKILGNHLLHSHRRIFFYESYYLGNICINSTYSFVGKSMEGKIARI